MEINSINMLIARVERSQSPAGNGDTASAPKSGQSALANSSSAGSSQRSQAPTVLIGVNYVKEQIQEIITSFPPYFPAGSPQRIDLIKGVKGVQEEIKSSPLPGAVKEKLAGQKLTDSSTDKEISTALEGVKQYTEEHSPAPSQSTDKSQTVNIVSIKI